MRMSPKRRRDTGRAVVPRTSGSYSYASATASQGGARVSAAVVLVFILASTVISLYDLHLLIRLLAR